MPGLCALKAKQEIQPAGSSHSQWGPREKGLLDSLLRLQLTFFWGGGICSRSAAFNLNTCQFGSDGFLCWKGWPCVFRICSCIFGVYLLMSVVRTKDVFRHCQVSTAGKSCFWLGTISASLCEADMSSGKVKCFA